jgi:hypothetical protein
MARFFPGVLLLVLFAGCCSPCHNCGLCEAQDDDDCFCCSDGSDSPKYWPPGPWWKRPDCGCPKKCRSYQEARQAVCEDSDRMVIMRGYR